MTSFGRRGRRWLRGALVVLAAVLLTSSSPVSAASQMDNVLRTIRTLESGGRYDEHSRAYSIVGANGSGNPTGAYQFVRLTWKEYDGYLEAYLAPKEVQDRRAREDVEWILARFPGVEWVPIVWYVGPSKAAQIRDGLVPLTWIPNPAFNKISVGDYQTRWLKFFNGLPGDFVKIDGPAQPAGLVPATRGSSRVLVRPS